MTTNVEFVIPLEKDDLTKRRNGQYFVDDVTHVRSIDAALTKMRTTLTEKGPRFILQHFDELFSVLVHGNKLDYVITLRAFDRMAKSIEFLCRDMEQKFPTDERLEFLKINKMHCYILCSLMNYLEDATLTLDVDLLSNGKKKKGSKKPEQREEWESRRDKTLLMIHRWLQLPLQNLWQPPIVEESFVQLIADVCYKTLEHDKDNRVKSDVRDTIFQILGVLVKRYVHNITCTIKIIQLVKMHEALAPYLAMGVANMVVTNNCPTFIADLAREIEQTTLEEASARNVSMFLETIATNQPELILPILENITDYLNNDSYSMRNCAINVMGIVIERALTNEDLTYEQKQKRNECFDLLEAHMLDVNTYVRSKVFQVLQKLCCENAIPVDRYGSVMTKTTPHLREKTATVRKQALVLLRTLLENNPFRMVLERTALAKKKAEVKKMYEKMQETLVAESRSGDEERHELWKTLSPGIVSAIKQYINYDSESVDSEDDEDEEEGDEGERYEEIRNLLIQKNFREAVMRVIKISHRMDNGTRVSFLDDAEKERLYLHLMLFIFLESSENGSEEEQPTTARWREQKKQIIQWRMVVSFLNEAETFAAAIQNALIQIELMLYSPTPTVAVEACTLLASAYQAKIPGAVAGVRKALSQVFSREESVRSNVAIVYKNIYLVKDNRAALPPVAAVNGLIHLFKGLQPGQSPALAHLMSIWLTNHDLTEQHIEVMWQKYSFKVPGTTVQDSRSAILLLAMVAQSQPRIVIANIDTIVKFGCENHEHHDLLLARDSCRALTTIKSEDAMVAPFRRPNDDNMFTKLFSLLTENFMTTDTDLYVSFANDAINVIYQLANQPEKLMRDILVNINDKMDKTEESTATLAKLLYIVGHAAIKHVAFLDTTVYKESKRRNALLEAKKGRKNQNQNNPLNRTSNVSVCSSASVSIHSSARKARQSIYRKQKELNPNLSTLGEDNGEEALGGATADDADAEAIESELETNILSDDGLFSHFVPIVLDVCQHPQKYNDEYVQAFGVLALTKMMLISAAFCQQNLQLAITILERSMYPEIRGNILTGLADLMTRFPNEVEPWTAHLYGRLRDPEISVRSTAVRVLSNLVKREMIRVKGQMSEMALCIIDDDPQIRLDAKQFFEELSRKGNVLYNILPDILSRLTCTEANIEEDNLHEIVKHVLGLLSKEKESDALLDKICQRLKMSTTDRQCRDLAFCLSLLQLGKKGTARLISNLPLIKNKLHIREVQKALKEIIDNARKKPENKDIVGQLENEVDRLLEAGDKEDDEERDADREAMPPPQAPPKGRPSAKKKNRRQKDSSDEDDEDDNEENEVQNGRTPTRSTRTRSSAGKTPKRKSNDLSPPEFDGSSVGRPKRRSKTPTQKNGTVEEVSDRAPRRRSSRNSRADTPSGTRSPPPKRTRTTRKRN